MGRVGRPIIHKDNAERLLKRRQEAKKAGKKAINILLTEKHKKMLDAFCENLKITQPEAIGYLLECAFDGELPNLKHDSDGETSKEKRTGPSN